VAVSLATLVIGPLLAIATSTVMATPAAASSPPPLSVFVGYADNLRPGPANFPTPWQGSPNVNFVGSGSTYDAGAIRIDNSSSLPVTVDDVFVAFSSFSFDLWGSGLTVPADGSLILTQTNAWDFDTSDARSGATCSSDNLIPMINVTVAGLITAYVDNGEVLNTGGIDLASCPSNTNESISWHSAPMGGSAAGQGGASPVVKQTTCTSGEPVDCATGEFFQNINDLSVPGRGDSLSFSRTYSSLAAATNGPLGPGWTHSYNMSLGVDATSGVVSVVQENGSTVSAAPCQPGVASCPSTGYRFPSFVEASLNHNGDGTYTFAHVDGNQFIFSAGGQLLQEVDRNGYATTLSYTSGRLTGVTDPSGRSLALAYGGNGDLASVTDPIGRKVSYGYDVDGNLASVTDVGGGTTSYSYDANHLLLTVTDPNGGTLTNRFDASGRVTS
jgi:YD repeat-containing protein